MYVGVQCESAYESIFMVYLHYNILRFGLPFKWSPRSVAVVKYIVSVPSIVECCSQCLNFNVFRSVNALYLICKMESSERRRDFLVVNGKMKTIYLSI